MAVADPQTKYALGSVLNHVLLHQTVIGEEALLQLAKAGEERLDLVVGCTGGGSNFAGIAFPFIPPPITGLGAAGGFSMELQDRAGLGLGNLQLFADDLVTGRLRGYVEPVVADPEGSGVMRLAPASRVEDRAVDEHAPVVAVGGLERDSAQHPPHRQAPTAARRASW